MCRNYPRRTRRDPEEYYDHIYRAIPGSPFVSRIIDHPRKLVTHNLCADPYAAIPEEIYLERTCFDEGTEEIF